MLIPINKLKLSPFRRLCVTIGELPTSFIESMSYYELLAWFCNYLQNTVIPAINKNGEATAELQEKFIELKNYVDTYFDNLDVEEMINNKLDQMVLDGTFDRIINQEIFGELNNKVDFNKYVYYITPDLTEDDVQAIFDLEKPKYIIFTDDYTFTHTMSLNSDTFINLNGKTLTFNIPSVEEDYDKAHGFENFKRTDVFKEYNGNSNISIISGTIIGGNFSMIHGANILIKNVHFVNSKNDHVLEVCATKGLTVEDCIFEGTYKTSNINKEVIQFDACDHGSFPFFDNDSETYDDTIVQNVIIRNNKFIEPSDQQYFFPKAIGSHSIQVRVKNIEIVGNTFEEMLFIGIEIIGGENIVIAYNNFKQTNLNTDIYGSMIMFRASQKNISVHHNDFDGNHRAIEMATGGLGNNTNKDVFINNNTFSNYISNINAGNINVIHCANAINANITNNSFYNTNIPIFRTVLSGEADLPVSKYFANFSNNTIKPMNNSVNPLVKCYAGRNYINNNTFDTDNFNTGNDSYIMIVTTADPTFHDIECSNNVFSQHALTNSGRVINVITSYEKVYDYKCQAYMDSQTVLTNKTLNFDYKQFNTLFLTLGFGTSTQTLTFKNFTQKIKLESRTFKFPVFNDTTTGIGTLVLNNDGTVNYSSTLGDVPIRGIWLENQY